MSSEVGIVEMGPTYTNVRVDHGAKVLVVPKGLPPETLREYIEYCSPPSLSRIAFNLAAFLLDNSPYARQVGLLGSIARNQHKALSDIDIGFFYDQAYAYRFGMVTLGTLDDMLAMGRE